MALSEFGNWKDIEGYPKYMVSDQGYVLSKTNMKFLSPAVSSSGYRHVNLYQGRVKVTHKVHRLVAEAFLESHRNCEFVDHIDHDKLNNSIGNMRWCTRSENNRNTNKRSGTMSSTYKGVCWHANKCKWIAYINADDKRKHLGYFDNEVQAAVAYNNAAINHYVEFACLNVVPIESVTGDA